MTRDPLDTAPRLLPALVAVAAMIVLAGLASLHVSTLTPPGAELERLIH
jgi:hypothetical protein